MTFQPRDFLLSRSTSYNDRRGQQQFLKGHIFHTIYQVRGVFRSINVAPDFLQIGVDWAGMGQTSFYELNWSNDLKAFRPGDSFTGIWLKPTDAQEAATWEYAYNGEHVCVLYDELNRYVREEDPPRQSVFSRVFAVSYCLGCWASGQNCPEATIRKNCIEVATARIHDYWGKRRLILTWKPDTSWLIPPVGIDEDRPATEQSPSPVEEGTTEEASEHQGASSKEPSQLHANEERYSKSGKISSEDIKALQERTKNIPPGKTCLVLNYKDRRGFTRPLAVIVSKEKANRIKSESSNDLTTVFTHLNEEESANVRRQMQDYDSQHSHSDPPPTRSKEAPPTNAEVTNVPPPKKVLVFPITDQSGKEHDISVIVPTDKAIRIKNDPNDNIDHIISTHLDEKETNAVVQQIESIEDQYRKPGVISSEDGRALAEITKNVPPGKTCLIYKYEDRGGFTRPIAIVVSKEKAKRISADPNKDLASVFKYLNEKECAALHTQMLQYDSQYSHSNASSNRSDQAATISERLANLPPDTTIVEFVYPDQLGNRHKLFVTVPISKALEIKKGDKNILQYLNKAETDEVAEQLRKVEDPTSKVRMAFDHKGHEIYVDVLVSTAMQIEKDRDNFLTYLSNDELLQLEKQIDDIENN